MASWLFDDIYPFLIISGFILFLNLIFCCYLMRLRREGQLESGYRQVAYTTRMTNDECAVCLEEFQESESIGQCPCKHNFHVNCLSKWLEGHQTCPICKMTVRPSHVTERTRLLGAGVDALV